MLYCNPFEPPAYGSLLHILLRKYPILKFYLQVNCDFYYFLPWFYATVFILNWFIIVFGEILQSEVDYGKCYLSAINTWGLEWGIWIFRRFFFRSGEFAFSAKCRRGKLITFTGYTVLATYKLDSNI